MLILLPPSETKRSGGTGASLGQTWNLSFPELDDIRRKLATTLCELSEDVDASIAALKIGPKQHDEVVVNQRIFESGTMPAIERFTGVLYDAIDFPTIDARGRDFLNGRVLIASALFGLVRATDPIPAYRLSFDSRLPSTGPLKNEWSRQGSAILEAHSGLILDLRSEGYVALAPLPERDNVFFVRAMGRAADGTLRALNHFNKKGKGVFVRALGSTFPHWVRHENEELTADSMLSIDSIETLLEWAKTYDIELERTDDPHVLQLVINEADYPPINARRS